MIVNEIAAYTSYLNGSSNYVSQSYTSTTRKFFELKPNCDNLFIGPIDISNKELKHGLT